MANVCGNSITIEATNSERREIITGFNTEQIDWWLVVPNNDGDREIFFESRWSPTPLYEGEMEDLSKMYPSALFFYKWDSDTDKDAIWICSASEGDKRKAKKVRKRAYRGEKMRFAVSTNAVAAGVRHRVELMPDGRVAADGENQFGECNVLSWENIKEISCGNWHTVGLCQDGTVVACGSNANGQCEVSDLPERAVGISCGRYHTAILLESGKVVIKGNLEQEVKPLKNQEADKVPFDPSAFPLFGNLCLNENVFGWEKMNDPIEQMSVGDGLTLRPFPKYHEVGFEVFNLKDEKIGELKQDLYMDSNLFSKKGGKLGSNEYQKLTKMLNNITTSVYAVNPLSKRRDTSKYAMMEVRLDYMEIDPQTGECHIYAQVEPWPPVIKIKSVFDAVIGVTSNNEIYVDGFCPCSDSEIRKLAGLNSDSKIIRSMSIQNEGDQNDDSDFDQAEMSDDLFESEESFAEDDFSSTLSPKDVIRQLLEEYNEIEVSGTQYEGRSGRIENVQVGDKLELVREPNNAYDKNAISIQNDEGSLGYLPRYFVKHLAPFLDLGAVTCNAIVSEVLPCSKQSKGAKKAILKVRLNYTLC